MSDIVERAKAHRGYLKNSLDTLEVVNGLLDEIERLRAEKVELVVRSQERNTTYERDVDQLEDEIERLRALIETGIRDRADFKAEIEHLRAINAELCKDKNTLLADIGSHCDHIDSLCVDLDKLRAINAELLGALKQNMPWHHLVRQLAIQGA